MDIGRDRQRHRQVDPVWSHLTTVFLGYDRKEDIAFKVARHSIRRRSGHLWVRPLIQDVERVEGRYWRAPDLLASTDFSLTRFLVPHLCEDDWAISVDCDFLFTRPIHELFWFKRHDKALQVVKHAYEPAQTIKMDAQVQHRYPRKNWSSLILWNRAHPAHDRLTLDLINGAEPAYLHRFGWCDEDEIGELPKEWNHLVGDSPPLDETPAGIHWTNGGPWLPGYEETDYAEQWKAEHALCGEAVRLALAR